MVDWICRDCGKRYSFRPKGGACLSCDGVLSPEMEEIGYAGFEKEGEMMFLFQCPICKKVAYDTAGHSVLCYENHDYRILQVHIKRGEPVVVDDYVLRAVDEDKGGDA